MSKDATAGRTSDDLTPGDPAAFDLYWAASLDDLRRSPTRLISGHNLIAMGLADNDQRLRQLPPPLRLPHARNFAGRFWEARTILLWMGEVPWPAALACSRCGGRPGRADC